MASLFMIILMSKCPVDDGRADEAAKEHSPYSFRVFLYRVRSKYGYIQLHSQCVKNA